jgi:hypothetical protein
VQIAKCLGQNESRNSVIAREVVKQYRAGRDIFVFGDVKNYLVQISEYCKCEIGEDEIGYYYGQQSDRELGKAAQKKITFLTYAMASEGLNLPWKDTIICATPPVSNLKQLKGRIDRIIPGQEKNHPLIIDFVDSYWDRLLRQGKSRYYGWIRESLEVKQEVYNPGSVTCRS